MKRLVPLLLALALPFAAFATDYTVQPAASTLGFSGTFQGEAFQGQFGQWNAVIAYDPGNLAGSHFDVDVSLSSVKTGDSDRDSALPGPDFFNVAKFPKAHFVSTSIHKVGATVVADGNLTMNGVTKPVSLDVAFKPQGSSATLDVNGTVKRLDFGLGSGDYADTSVIGAAVKVTAHLQLAAK
jgi:polyisoprenoid-binding protein YceI